MLKIFALWPNTLPMVASASGADSRMVAASVDVLRRIASILPHLLFLTAEHP